jgi:NAD(P)-dependent dehydrogenase (short-subunit alcohol dehydrogenase family)
VTGLLAGKAGLVTGAAGGIGRACAVRLGAEGGAVVVSDLESAAAGGEETVALVEAAGGTAGFLPCDVREEHDCEALAARVVELHGTLDFAVNNAGVAYHGLFADTPTEEFDRLISVNLRGVFVGMKHQIRHMLACGGGSIVNMASNAGLQAVKHLTAYTAAKHGVVGLTKTAAIEYANDGIRVNAVCPGAIHTALADGIPEERLRQIVFPQALRRLGRPEEVAAAVAWLCSDESSFVTGVPLPVDAGSVAWLSVPDD